MQIILLLILVVGVFLFFQMKHVQHRIFTIAIIALILFTYFSFSLSVAGEEINWGTLEGVEKAAGLYFSWMGNIFTNFKSLTGNAIEMDWKTNDNSTRPENQHRPGTR